MHKLIALSALLFMGAATASASHPDEHGGQCRARARGILPSVFGFRDDAGAMGYSGRNEVSGYAGPEVYGYWSDYGWFGPQYGGWYGPGGYTYYSRTGDYAAPFLPPPSMRGPPPGMELYPPPY